MKTILGWRPAVVLAAAALSACASLRAPDGPGPLEVATRFRQGLQSGDEAVVRSTLAPDVLIYESGGRETSRDEYMSGHMKGDMAFLGASKVEALETLSGGAGDTAWVSTRARITGQHRGKPVDAISTETLVLHRTLEGWRIAHIHWSSRPASKDH